MNQKAEPPTNPLTVLVELEIRSDTTTMAQWLDVWGARGLDALANEPETTYSGVLRTHDKAFAISKRNRQCRCGSE